MIRRIRRYVIGALAVAIVVGGAAWAADWLLLRRHVAQDSDAFGQVEVHYRYSVHLKNRRIEQRNEKPRMVECVHSMFPHYNDSPCWYLVRHTEQDEDLNGGQWHLFSGE